MRKSAVFVLYSWLAVFFAASACGDRSKKGTIVSPPEELSGLPSNVVSLQRLRDLREGTDMVVRTVYKGDKIEDFHVKFVAVVDDIFPPLSLILLEASDSAFVKLGGVSAGMSGSPVIWNGRTVGALSYSFDAQPRAPFYFFATPIESMLNWDPGFDTKKFRAQKPVAWKNGTVVPLSIPIVGTGISSRLYESLREKIRARGISLSLDKVESFATAGTAKSEEISYPIVPGSPLGVSLVLGDEVNIVGVGTATYVDGSDILAFGHPMLDNGEVGFPIVGAKILAEISNYGSPYKFFTIGNTIMGTINLDITPGIRGTLAEIPRFTDMILNLKYPDGRLTTLRHQMPKKGLLIGDQAYLLAITSMLPVFSRWDNNSKYSVRVSKKIWFDEVAGTDPSIDCTSISAGVGWGLLGLIDIAGSDLFWSYIDAVYQDFEELTPSKIEVDVDVVDSLLTGKVIDVSVDTVGYAGSVLEAMVEVRVGIGGRTEIPLRLSLPDTIPAGMYDLDVGPFVELIFGDDTEDPMSIEEHFKRVNDSRRNTMLGALLRFTHPEPETEEPVAPSDSTVYAGGDGGELPQIEFEILVSQDIGLAVAGRKTKSIQIKKKE